MQPGSNGGNRLDADALWAYALGGDSDTDTRGAAWALVCACRISAESRCREAWQDITRDTATAAARSFYECLRYSTSAEVPREESPDDEPTPRVLLHLSIFYGNISVATRVQVRALDSAVATAPNASVLPSACWSFPALAAAAGGRRGVLR